MSLRNDADSFVYFIRPIGMPGPTKVGCSLYPQDRLKLFMSWSPVALEVAVTTPGNLVLEHRFHALFMHLHSHNEWFRADPEIDRVIAEIRAGTFAFDSLPGPQRHYARGRPGAVAAPPARVT